MLRLIPPNVRGKSRLSRFLLRNNRNVESARVTDAWGNTYIVPSLRDPIAFYLLIDGMYEPWTVKLLLELLSPGDIFVDVGANIGLFSVLASQCVADTGQVLAIEASPSVFPYLQENIRLNQTKNVRLEQIAILDRNEQQVTFYEAPSDHFGMGSLAPQFRESNITVSTRRLDSFLDTIKFRNVDVLKVDVEGFEKLVLDDAQNLLTKNTGPIVIFEFCDWAESRAAIGEIGDTQRQLREWGYQIWRLKDYVLGKAPLSITLTSGCEMLVAQKM